MSPAARRYLVTFGYDGRPFDGWARQPGRRTIEGTIRDALVRRGFETPGRPLLDVASRTDRGVSARANALALWSPLPPEPLLRVLNGLAPEIFFTEVREVDGRFRVRAAVRREYRYFESRTDRHPERWRALLPRFRDRTIDVRSFGRSIPADHPAWRRVEEIRLVETPSYLRLDVRAPSFVWGMVRKIVAAFRAVDQGKLSEETLDAALAGRRRIALPLAEPERLLLWAVDYELPPGVRPGHWMRRQRAYFQAEAEAAALRGPLLEAIHGDQCAAETPKA